MKYSIDPLFEIIDSKIVSIVNHFDTSGLVFENGHRNKIKIFEIDGKSINVKFFKIPFFINKIAYKYFRKSKARRSFEYATILLEKGIGTPQPIAYFENRNFIGVKDSYYVSEHFQCDLTSKELVEILDYPDNDTIWRQLTKFTFDLHEKGIEFLDHSPGNTLIKKTADGNYNFFLVDLNRMRFHENMSFDLRMKNLQRLTHVKEMVAIISEEYAKFVDESESVIFDTLWKYSVSFQHKKARKKRIKSKLKFWKKSDSK